MQNITVQNESRPVSKALDQLEALYGWPITYEDAPFINPNDLVPGVGQRRWGMKTPTISFMYETPSVTIPAAGDLSKVSSAIRGDLNSFNTAYGAEASSLIQDTYGHFHIIPAQIRGATGTLAAVIPLLNMPISIPNGRAPLSPSVSFGSF